MRLKRCKPKDRWRQRRGVIASLTLLLWEAGWDAYSATQWKAPDGALWMLREEDEDGDRDRDESNPNERSPIDCDLNTLQHPTTTSRLR